MILRRLSEKRAVLGSRGQATLEYLLLIIIVVILILSLCYQFNDSFRIYAEAFFDGYVRCLLETGELPGTGSVCSQSFTKFDPKAGKSLLKNNLPDSGSGGAGSAQAQAAAAAAKAHGNSESRGGSGGNAYVGHFTPLGGRAASTPMGKAASGASSGGGASSNSDDLSGASITVVRRSGGYNSGDRKVLQVYEEGEAADVEKPKETSKKVGKKSADSSSNLRATRTLEDLHRKPAGNNDGDSGDFTISGLVRLIFIILIIIAIVLVLGGQLMQIARAGEKGGGDG